MIQGPIMTSYVYLGVSKTESTTFVDIDAADSGREPILHAHSLLAEHLSCERVEIWCDEERIGVVARASQVHAS
jgi:hypothetical protein